MVTLKSIKEACEAAKSKVEKLTENGDEENSTFYYALGQLATLEWLIDMIEDDS